MKHLFLPHERLNHEGASPLYRLLMAQDYNGKATILLDGVRAGWLIDAKEAGPEGLPMLLGYLATFPAQEREETWSEQRLNSVLWERWDGVSEGPRPWSSQVDLALAILDHGADPWATDRAGRDALDQVNSLMWVPVWDRLRQRSDAPTAGDIARRRQTLRVLTRNGREEVTLPWLHAAAADDRPAWLPHLLDHGLDVNQPDDVGRTPLFYAASAEVVQVLLDHGADLMVRDGAGATIQRVWSERVRTTDRLNAMSALVQPLLNERFQDDPEALKDQNRPALYHMAATGTKDATLTFMRGNGFTVNDRWTVDGRTTSLFGHLALSMLAGRDRSPLLQHLVDRLDDPWFESVPGVPDLVMAWIAGGLGTLERRVEERLRERYHLSGTDVNGWTGFVRELVPALERLGDWLLDHQPQALLGFSTGVVHSLKLVLNGRVVYEDGKALERWRKEALTNPDLVMTPAPTHGANDRCQVRETLAPAGWIEAQDEAGEFWFWRWAMLGATALRHPLDDDGCDSVAFHLGGLMGRPATAHQPGIEPPVPYDRRAVYALIGLLGNPLSNRARDRGQHAEDAWDLDEPVRFALRQALDAGVPVDSTLPGFDTLFERVRQRLPNLARALESHVLTQTLVETLGTDVDATPAVRSRSRL